MTIYKLITEDSELGTGVTFHPSRGSAYTNGVQYKRDHSEHAPTFEIQAIDFKPTKTGFLSVLSTHAPYRDNG